MSLLRGVSSEDAALKLLQLAPLYLSPWEGCVLLLPDRGGSLKGLHRPNLLGVCWTRFKKKLKFHDHRVATLIALNAGLMKPRKGFTAVTSNKNWGWASEIMLLIDKRDYDTI